MYLSLNERPLKEIRQHLQVSIKGSDRTKAIDIRAMSSDNRKDHRYFLFVASQAHENTLRVHLDEWLFKSFPKAQVQATTLYPIRVDSVNAKAILDPITGHVSPQAASSIGEENGSLSVSRIGWLSQPGKKYGSIVLYLKEKSQANAMIARGFLEGGGESGITQAWEERGKAEQRCFNCQKQGHMARSCKEATVCGNCAQVGHQHRECLISTPKCPKCGGNHRAKDHKSGTTTIISSSQQNPSQATNPSGNTNPPILIQRGEGLISSDKELSQAKTAMNFFSNETHDPSDMINEW